MKISIHAVELTVLSNTPLHISPPWLVSTEKMLMTQGARLLEVKHVSAQGVWSGLHKTQLHRVLSLQRQYVKHLSQWKQKRKGATVGKDRIQWEPLGILYLPSSLSPPQLPPNKSCSLKYHFVTLQKTYWHSHKRLSTHTFIASHISFPSASKMDKGDIYKNIRQKVIYFHKK